MKINRSMHGKPAENICLISFTFNFDKKFIVFNLFIEEKFFYAAHRFVLSEIDQK